MMKLASYMYNSLQYGMTQLILATKAKNEEAIKLLLKAGADLNLQTKDVSILRVRPCKC